MITRYIERAPERARDELLPDDTFAARCAASAPAAEFLVRWK